MTWEHSSVGRASALQAGGHRFEPYCSHQKLSLIVTFIGCGNGSVVERRLAKVNVAGSNLVSRSKIIRTVFIFSADEAAGDGAIAKW